jgi:hypothetical protein
MKHPTKIKNYPYSLRDLAREIASLRYDSLRDFYQHLAYCLEKDSAADMCRGRTHLAGLLKKLSENNKTSQELAGKIWKLCKPYMGSKKA